jgi:2-polyprenyl-6-methoxyphenol hydroxylase-like FAD-dependent oxidoreductase
MDRFGESPMSDGKLPLIVGAGPVGTAAAMFLARGGVATRLVEKSTEKSTQSRALAVNPRTLEILDPTGISQKMIDRGIQVDGACFWRGGKRIRQIDIGLLDHKYKFLVALSQATSERFLEEELNRVGGQVERGTEMVACRNTADGVEVDLKNVATGASETVACPWMLAADGAHSVARHQLNIDFPGSSFKHEWFLADVTLSTTLAEDRAHIAFTNGGFLFLLRVVGDDESKSGDPLWRVLGNMQDPVQVTQQVLDAKATAPPIWLSSFHISHRLNAQMQVGNICFAGDAAHIHSPMGARGMNLGIEDAWVFAKLVLDNRLQEYGAMRHPVDHGVVKRVEFFSRMVKGESALSSMARLFGVGVLSHIPLLQKQILKTVSGLDHPLPSP